MNERGFGLNAWTFALVLVCVGLVISGYLSYVKLLDAPIYCSDDGTFSCGVVTNSRYSTLGGIPVAYLGFGLYMLIGVLLLVEHTHVFLRDNGRLLVLILGLVGWTFSMWLVYVQAVVIQAYCQWCLSHEFNFTVLFGIIVYLFWEDVNN